MSLLRRKGLFESTKVLFLPIAAISPIRTSPAPAFPGGPGGAGRQHSGARRTPAPVRPLVQERRLRADFGERRLRASRMAGLTEVPCILVSVDSQGSSLLALVENLQRRDLNFVEEATALAKADRDLPSVSGGGGPPHRQVPVGGGQQAAPAPPPA